MKITKMAESPKARLMFFGVMTTVLALAAVSVSASKSTRNHYQQKQVRKTTDPPTMPKGKFGQDLFLAIDHRDMAAVKGLIGKGADPNSRNGLEFTPIYVAAASYQMDVMGELLKAGADPDAESNYGTPLMFASATGNVAGADILLAKNVNVNAIRNDGMSVLMMASYSGNPALVGDLLQHKADVSIKDDNGATALMYAARAGNDQAGKLLIDAGIEVDGFDNSHTTPLMAAAKAGHVSFVKMLLAAKADPNKKDAQGYTPLILAAKYSDNADLVKALLAGGANAKTMDSQSRNAGYVAAMRGHQASATALGVISSTHAVKTPRQAVSASLSIIQSSMKKFGNSTSCLSCHQEGLGRIATGMAADTGFKLDPAVAGRHKAMLTGMTGQLKPLHEGALKNPEVMKQVPLIEINEVNTSDTWLLAGMAAHHQAPTDATTAMVRVLARQQSKDGQWSMSLPRAPMQSSPFTFTALAIRSLKAYSPKVDATVTGKQIKLAQSWLMSAPAKTSEDRASRLLGLKWSMQKGVRKAVAEIKADQRPDGGWSQLPNLASDAYATGQALYALHEGGGMSVNDPVYQKGVKFLLRNQDDDGSWFVNKRAIPANNYFDGGFPHGQSQYSSFNGTCYAMMALLETLK
jgi:ankyrin repeat protein